MVYNRDDHIRPLTDYYHFCNRTFWRATIVQAPANGWRLINQETLANFKRNGTAIDLLRHIAYVEYAENNLFYAPIVMENTPVIDYRREDIQKKIRNGEIQGTAAGRSSYQVILDTDDGYINWGGPEGQHDEPAPELNNSLARFAGDGPRNGVTEYESEPHSGSDPEDYFSHNKLARRMKKAGWPGDG
ncbi:uncharacterized protein BDZ83DRAFT_725090 [Colletotrichum acutatum]|uniref:Uncharacterized protein n=1 Tax=Glomerella acutata TaxID=27357 RepID=A0AAD8U795_GLOAC|nr:uncharacterized protein BDZ83DRAFT_725090 [Colletotrichum acutatum]KAK1703666.1 hypothetical protein BDZ83DRAFT_725090 [Colletotrichum acutatum]